MIYTLWGALTWCNAYQNNAIITVNVCVVQIIVIFVYFIVQFQH